MCFFLLDQITRELGNSVSEYEPGSDSVKTIERRLSRRSKNEAPNGSLWYQKVRAVPQKIEDTKRMLKEY